MEKSLHFRVNEGVHMVIEANAKKNHQTVSDWLRHAVDEQIKRTINSRALDRIDERVYDLTKSSKELTEGNKQLASVNQEILIKVQRLQKTLDGLIAEAVS
jgi:hypothetical protein